VRRHRDQEKCYEVVWCVYPEEYGESPKKILDPERDTKATVARGTGGEVFAWSRQNGALERSEGEWPGSF